MRPYGALRHTCFSSWSHAIRARTSAHSAHATARRSFVLRSRDGGLPPPPPAVLSDVLLSWLLSSVPVKGLAAEAFWSLTRSGLERDARPSSCSGALPPPSPPRPLPLPPLPPPPPSSRPPSVSMPLPRLLSPPPPPFFLVFLPVRSETRKTLRAASNCAHAPCNHALFRLYCKAPLRRF
jgi:hypothetical protein